MRARFSSRQDARAVVDGDAMFGRTRAPSCASDRVEFPFLFFSSRWGKDGGYHFMCQVRDAIEFDRNSVPELVSNNTRRDGTLLNIDTGSDLLGYKYSPIRNAELGLPMIYANQLFSFSYLHRYFLLHT
jgi:hypothetical protein